MMLQESKRSCNQPRCSWVCEQQSWPTDFPTTIWGLGGSKTTERWMQLSNLGMYPAKYPKKATTAGPIFSSFLGRFGVHRLQQASLICGFFPRCILTRSWKRLGACYSTFNRDPVKVSIENWWNPLECHRVSWSVGERLLSCPRESPLETHRVVTFTVQRLPDFHGTAETVVAFKPQ